uniref:BZIP domain-containing protein n=1 Tax=Ulva partita TaxID=1605170 RepID=A0A1C9ZPT7_9CHLO|nr:hypothetical protein [Ulva partita]
MGEAIAPDVRSMSDRFPASTASENCALPPFTICGNKAIDGEATGHAGAGEAVRKQRRRISNRESARRLRKQRSEKLHNLMAQQDSLAGLTDGLKAQIAAHKAKLKSLQTLNDGLQLQLNMKVILPSF